MKFDFSYISSRPELFQAIFDISENINKCFVTFSSVSQAALQALDVNSPAIYPILLSGVYAGILPTLILSPAAPFNSSGYKANFGVRKS